MIFLAGASGYVGERVLDDLLRLGHDVVAHVHSDRSREMMQSKYPALRIVQCDLANADEVRSIIPDCVRAVIYLPGLLRMSNGQTFEGVHVAGVRNLLAEFKKTPMKQSGEVEVRRWVHMSALGVRPNAPQKYYETKWRAEEMIRGSGLGWTILRPSLIFDDRRRRQHNFVSEIVRAIRMAPFIPILGSGKFVLQPVSVDDVSQTILQSLAKSETIQKTYELGGPEKITYTEIMRRVARGIGSKKLALHIPMWLMFGSARLLQRFSWFPITVDELQMLTSGNYIRDAEREQEWRRMFNVPMKAFNEITLRQAIE